MLLKDVFSWLELHHPTASMQQLKTISNTMECVQQHLSLLNPMVLFHNISTSFLSHEMDKHTFLTRSFFAMLKRICFNFFSDWLTSFNAASLIFLRLFFLLSISVNWRKTSRQSLDGLNSREQTPLPLSGRMCQTKRGWLQTHFLLPIEASEMEFGGQGRHNPGPDSAL